MSASPLFALGLDYGNLSSGIAALLDSFGGVKGSAATDEQPCDEENERGEAHSDPKKSRSFWRLLLRLRHNRLSGPLGHPRPLPRSGRRALAIIFPVVAAQLPMDCVLPAFCRVDRLAVQVDEPFAQRVEPVQRALIRQPRFPQGFRVDLLGDSLAGQRREVAFDRVAHCAILALPRVEAHGDDLFRVVRGFVFVVSRDFTPGPLSRRK